MARGLAFFLSLTIGWLGAYASGLFPWIGCASFSTRSLGAGGIAIGGAERSGWDFGAKSFVFLRGQQVVVDWDAEVRAGSLWIHVYEPFDGTLGDGSSHWVTQSGKGEWTMDVGKTAVYRVSVEPSPARGGGQGWDLTYTAKWGARWAPAR